MTDPITNAQRWGDELAPGHDVLARVEKQLFSHTPTVSGDCVCGWALHTRRGISHVTHLVQVLASAGLLAVATGVSAWFDDPPPRPSCRPRSFLTGGPRTFADGTS